MSVAIWFGRVVVTACIRAVATKVFESSWDWCVTRWKQRKEAVSNAVKK